MGKDAKQGALRSQTKAHAAGFRMLLQRVYREKSGQFLLYQFGLMLATLLVCTLASTAASYLTLRGELYQWSVDTSAAALERSGTALDTGALSSARESYTQLVLDFNDNTALRFYVGSSITHNTTNALTVQKYMRALKARDAQLAEVGIYYPATAMLITSDQILHEAYSTDTTGTIAHCAELCAGYAGEGTSAFFRSELRGGAIRLYKPIYSGIRLRALVFFDYDTATLKTELERARLEDGTFWIVGEDGTVLLCTEENGTEGLPFSETSVYSDAFRTAASGAYTVKTREECVVSFRNNAGGGWSYVCATPTRKIMEPVELVLRNLLFALALTVLFGIAAAMVSVRLQYRPVRPIVELLDGFREPDTAETTVLSPLNSVYTGVRELIDTVGERNRELRALEPLLHDGFVSWFFANLPTDPTEIAENMAAMRVHFRYPRFRILALRPMQADDAFDVDYAADETTERAMSLFGASGGDLRLCRSRTDPEAPLTLWGILNTARDDAQDEALCRELTRGTSCGVFVCVGTLSESLESLAAGMPEVIKGLQASWLWPEPRVVGPETVRELEKRELCGGEKRIQEIVQLARRHRPDEASRAIRVFASELAAHAGVREAQGLMLLLCSRLEPFAGNARTVPTYEQWRDAPDLPALAETLCESLRVSPDGDESGGANAKERLAAAAKKQVDLHLGDPQLSLQTVAAALEVTPAYISRIFPECTGMTFVEYVNGEKMKLAREKLAHTDISVRELAAALGYSSVQYFITRFKATTGMTPSAYRREQEHGERQ